MNLKAIIFDFDGTIADTESFYADNFFDAMKLQGVICDEEDRISTIGFGPYEKVAMMEEKYHVKLDGEKITFDFRKMNVDRFPEDASDFLFDDVEEALIYCKKKGLKIYICSNTDSVKVERIVKQMGIFDYFDGIVGKDISGARKPSAQPYNFIVEHYGFDKNQVLAVEDSLSGVYSSKAANIMTIGLERVRGLKLNGDITISSLKELEKVL